MSNGEGERLPAILASDAERERAVGVLRDAVVEGRLTLEEFSERVGLVQVARTDQDLAVLTGDLPDLPPATASPIAEHDRHRAVFSRIERHGHWDLPTRSEYRAVFGTIDLDLTQARLAGDETEIEVYNLFSTVTLLVPEGVEVSVSGGGAFASQVLEQPTPRMADAPKLRIRTRGPGGTLYVRSRPPEPGALARLLGKS